MKYLNDNLISLKCVLFLFFGGIGCLLPYLPLHMLEIGLTRDEARIISIIAPCVALIGPLVAGPLADRLNETAGGNPKNKNGRFLRLMIAACLILASIFYFILTGIPNVVRFEPRKPLVSFTCDPHGGVVLQERCMVEKTCYHWEGAKKGSLFLTNCRYVCQTPPQAYGKNTTDDLTTNYPDEDTSAATDDYYDEASGSPLNEVDLAPDSDDERRRKRQADTPLMLEPPHLCYLDPDIGHMCQVYTDSSKKIEIKVNLLQSALSEEEDEEEWCGYPLDGFFDCRITQKIVDSLAETAINNTCHPVVQCDVDNPYNAPNSVLAESQCVQVIGQPELTFWSYLIVRSIADIFPTAALVLLDAAVIIATRETSSGRSDVGRQMAVGSIGLALCAPLIGIILDVLPAGNDNYTYSGAIYLFVVLMLICAAVLIFANGMPLSPPEWWWHTRCGMLALPLSAVRKYGLETGALVAVMLLLGVFWSTLDTYLPWHLRELNASPFLIGLTLTIGILPAIPFMWHAEKILDYCGHANVLITAFVVYIIRYTVLSAITNITWILIFEVLEIFTLALMWIAAVLYMRHLVPRRFTVTGQALPVIAHFCLGRCIGAIIGGVVPTGAPVQAFQSLYCCMAISATVVAVIYFLLYHLYLKPRYAAPTTGPPQSPPTVAQGMNGNGSYTPLRVYHNGRDKKGQFRY